jgi:ketosteroid isomerase-like protein
MGEATPTSIVLRFIECINAGDSEGVAALTAEHYKLTDIPGRVYTFTGKAAIKASWDEYLKAYPDYKIHVHHVLTSGDGVAIVGQTSGSHVSPEIEETETVLWIAELEDGLVTEWRIYSDKAYAEQS